MQVLIRRLLVDSKSELAIALVPSRRGFTEVNLLADLYDLQAFTKFAKPAPTAERPGDAERKAAFEAAKVAALQAQQQRAKGAT